MARIAEYEDLDALSLAALVARGEVTAVELVDEAISRVERWNPRLSFVVERMDDEARRRARSLDAKGPLAGVPYLLKDLLASYAGVPLRSGSRLYAGYVPEHDSELVRRHRAAGLVAVAKSATPELGLTPVTEPETHAPTETPWKAGHTSGGSSGGSAAGVAARVVPIGHGGDGGGSIRIPAGCCGVFGLKPSRGRTPSGPDASENWFGFAIEHALTRSVRDSAALLDATSAREPHALFPVPLPERPFVDEVSRAPGKLRVAFSTRPHLPGVVHADCVAAVRDVAKLLEGLGHEVVEAGPDIDGHAFAMEFVTHVAVATALELEVCEEALGRRATRADVSSDTWLVALLGRTRSALDFAQARRSLQARSRQILGFYDRFDVLLTPTLGRPPVRHGELRPKGAEHLLQEIVARGSITPVLKLPGLVDKMAERVFEFIPFTPVANVTGQPSMSVPLVWNAEGLPIGTMFTARLGDEATLFRLAGQLEAARPWAARKPPAPTDR